MKRREQRGRRGNLNQPVNEPWQAPPKAERLQKKHNEERLALKDEPIETQLAVASLDRNLPMVDLHGLTTEDVVFEVDQIISQNPGECVRIIYGAGTGALARAVMQYLHRISHGKGQRVLGFRQDAHTHSVVLKVAGDDK
ncbi:MAG: hypothetical protein COW24_02085 [Candidatus Kerfeldbacteria bacterium CG15_BIG_FIL_POST_REV_8_21_14_020_45_12]|uniref:Smr domain-containing protein n=1 Tax=Candidatus Kerfeldbacteria bacterium CG15_BIG_FIL_POST_REV_8_21_14_020_45_12 TaxID=2014247 RepID=A0A2M7H4B4_9BACT|nr:MAG: hypothetical protein COW24_02085 [Candidatus Kerfeldbacteria bacterium CG15_BIG_FIL_POST_REV_8_21_14_020_45_12]PJA93622.1 MAG: hypothetical protein CO132_02225 [Candidatus Kerfeldbacteria bacterium CG_4_9_14_3_um_filter_45_8]